MCGRFTLEPTPKFYQRFKVQNRLDNLKARYNIAPGQEVPVIVRQSPNQIKEMRWGLIPAWAQDEKIGYQMINARCETLEEKPSFRAILKSRRCLVPASGFYEWQATKAGKIPHYVKLKKESIFAMAGLYDIWHDGKRGKDIYSFTIITTSANSLLKEIHNRMPVILSQTEEDVWLDQEIDSALKLRPLLDPYQDQVMEEYVVSKKVNFAKLDAKELIEPEKLKEIIKQSLFLWYNWLMPKESNNNSAFHFFLYLVSFLALGFLAVGLGMILFQIINKLLPDLSQGRYYFNQSTLKNGIASVFVALPVYLFFVSLINKKLKKEEIDQESKVRKWLTYIILFIAAAVIIVDLVTLIYNFLDGETAGRFLLKVLVVFLIAASIFGYYFWEIRKKQLANKKYPADKISFIVLLVVALIILISAFFVVDSPQVARQKRIDQQTISDLLSLESSINEYYREKDKLPENIAALAEENLYVPKSGTAVEIEYSVIDELNFQLCADFKRDNTEDQERGFYEGEWQHGAGLVCFDKKVYETEGLKPYPIDD